MKSNEIRLPLLIAASVLLAGVFGCPGLMPGPESVLEGTWELNQSADPAVTDWLLTFDSRGDLTEVSYEVAGVRKTWTDPPATVSVDGDQVRIAATQSGNGLNFYGVLDSVTDPTIATGSLSANMVVGNLTISVPQGEATLVKQ
jgi:hypothetical protein